MKKDTPKIVAIILVALFYLALVFYVATLDKIEKDQKEKVVNDRIEQLEKQVEALSGALAYKVNKIESEWITDDSTQRYLEYQSWEFQYTFSQIYKYTFIKTGYAIFTGEGGIYSRYLARNEISLVPKQLFDNKD